MRKSLVALLLMVGAAASTANLALAAALDADGMEGLKMMNGQMSQELRSRSARLGTSSGTSDTTWVGYTPGHSGPGNYWSIYAGFGKDGYYRPTNGVPHKGNWDFESPVNGDSLQGWWPLRDLYNTTGGQTRTDRNRPWWCMDLGNQANYRINQANGRTFGVVGVWHRDNGNASVPAAPRHAPNWVPAQGSFAAWMGLRADGDNSFTDPITNNPFNERVLKYHLFGAISPSGNDNGFPGYGGQMDQMLYRDIDFAGAPANSSLTISFKYRTVLATGVNTTASTRSGWFDSDPLGVTSGPTNPQPNNFISSSDAGDALAPADSFMVYVGAGVENNTWLPAASNFGQGLAAQPVYDKQRRWFGEVLHWDRDPNSPSANPQPLFYRELLSTAGVNPAGADSGANNSYVTLTRTISSSTLSSMLTKNNKIRLVFRVKTNRGFDDEGTAYSSNDRGAVVVDAVTYQIGAGPVVSFGDFENASDINNATNVSAVTAWKSTGKPPSIYMHTHLFSDLIYDDLCGQKGDISRQCNMSGIVISAGDHDNGEAAGGLVDGTAERERNDNIISPTIQLVGPYTNAGGTNTIGLKAPGVGAGDADASEDYYLWYDIYTAIMDPFTKGNLWRFTCLSYPANAKANHGSYPAWGQMRFPPFIIFNPDPQCLIDFEQLVANGMVKTSNGNGLPDSIQIGVGKVQQCFRFNVSSGCSPTEGAYFDNISLALIDGQPAQLTASIWDWINDAFPANETAGLPGTANFDTCGAHVMTGVNNAQATNDNNRFDVPGDSVAVSSSANTARVDMVFRILPGPGNYEPKGRPDIGTIVRRPDNRAIVTKGDGSFWDQYRQIPGDFASPNAIVLHHNAVGGWDPNVWNSARCDTSEVSVFARQAPGSANVQGGPLDATVWSSTYHESDPHFNTLGISHPRCFVTSATAPVTSQICDGTIPTYISSRPEHADVTGFTKEYTKIIPDGLLTPGSHVEYFFRDQKDTAVPSAPSGFVPDTNVVFQNPTEGSTDGHRWQEFSVLPNAWKKTTYKHPVTATFGTGPSCLLVIDNNDRRGNERVWVSVSDTIGAVPQRWWGAHNGWHAVGGGDLDDPADNRNGKNGQPGYVAEHLGQPGSGGSWDMYQVKGSESLTTGAGSIGSRRANHSGTPGQAIVIAKSSKQGPTPEMLNAYYTMMLFLSGDLNSGVLGPYANRSQNDAGVIIDWLDAASSATQTRGFWAIGDGFAESNIFDGEPLQTSLMLNYLGTDVLHNNYIQYSGNTDDLAMYRLLPGWQNKGAQQVEIFGVRNLCLWTNDVIVPAGVGLPTLATVTSEYDKRSAPGSYAAPAGVFKDFDATSPYKTLVDGWDIEHLTGPADVNTVDRNGYFYKIFVNIWSKFCQVQGTPLVTLDVHNLDGDLVNFMNLRNNPLAKGEATINFGLAKADRVEVKVFDVSGRLVRTLADRQFAAGPQTLKWDGTDNVGRQVARGVYFTQVKYQNAKFAASRKLTVLK